MQSKERVGEGTLPPLKLHLILTLVWLTGQSRKRNMEVNFFRIIWQLQKYIYVVMPLKAQLKQKQGGSGITTLSKLTLELCKGPASLRTVKQEPEVGHLMTITTQKERRWLQVAV